MQAADALEEAHGRGVIHRDIKSANLIVTDKGQLKVLDFGLAKFVRPGGVLADGTQSRDSAAGLVQGTFSYMSPEQALGRTVDRRTDLFSLGVVLYEMLTGRLPFTGDSVTDVLDRIIHHEPAAVARFNYDVPPELEAVVRKSLEKDPGFRYQSARELYIDLHNLRRDMSGVERRWGTVRQEAELLRADTTRGAAASRNAVAVLTFSNITRDPVDDWVGSGIAETVTSDLKNLQGLTVIGRAQIFDALKNISTAVVAQLDEALGSDRTSARRHMARGRRIPEARGSHPDHVAVHRRRDGGHSQDGQDRRAVAQIFDLQDRIVYELTEGLNLTLAQSEIAAIEQDETQSVEAYEAYSRGMMNLRMAGRDSIERAVGLFEKAVDRDPAYASAWAALGQAYELKGSFLSMPDLLEQSLAALHKALALNPRLPQIHGWIGTTLSGLGRYGEAEASLRQAVSLDPRNANTHSSLARVYWIGQGRLDEAMTELRAAIALNPQAGYSYLQLALLHALKGEYALAEDACRHAIDLQEHYLSGTEGLLIVGAHARLGYVYYLEGRYPEAVREYEKEMTFLSSTDHALRERTTIEVTAKLGAAHLRSGNLAEAERHFNQAIKAYQSRLARGVDDPFTKYLHRRGLRAPG